MHFDPEWSQTISDGLVASSIAALQVAACVGTAGGGCAAAFSVLSPVLVNIATESVHGTVNAMFTGTPTGDTNSTSTFDVPEGEVVHPNSVGQNGVWDSDGGVSMEVSGGTPEPSTLMLFGMTAAGLGLARWRQRRIKQP